MADVTKQGLVKAVHDKVNQSDIELSMKQGKCSR